MTLGSLKKPQSNGCGFLLPKFSTKCNYSLTDKVIEYQNHPELSALHNTIINEIMIIIYNLPSETHLIQEEDASEFLLFMEPKLDRIIANYKSGVSDFKTYLCAILQKKIKSFYKTKNVQLQREMVINTCYSGYEYEINEEANITSYVAERRDINVFESPALHKLKFLCRSSKTVKKRLFIYIMYIALNLQYSEITAICEQFGFDTNETLELYEKINNLAPNREHSNIYKERRNISWTRSLFLQNDKAVRNYLSDYTMDSFYQSRIDKYEDSFNYQKKVLNESKTTVSRTLLSEIFGISVASAGASVYYTKNIIKYCLGEYVSAQNLGISNQLFDICQSDSWHFAPEPFKENLFVPSEEFRIL